jgi:hypothetical protein
VRAARRLKQKYIRVSGGEYRREGGFVAQAGHDIQHNFCDISSPLGGSHLCAPHL